jgi:hypothetical protein
MEERTIKDMCVVCSDHGKASCGYEERGIQGDCQYNDFINRGYELAEKDIIALIESRIGEILGNAQPATVLRRELRGLINKIKEE